MKYDYQTADTAQYDILKKNAQHNRNNPTEAEALLWQYLKADGLGVTFKRQHIIGDYIVDFVCMSHRLIIEMDGGYHQTLQQKQNDQQRTEWLESRNYRVIRFTNDELFRNINDVLRKIEENLYE
ncbi:MAG: endonuclease domain-containing protein [Prevotella sp.]|nr:endonuclease domain-containing protein [Prevotella sp.]